MSFLPSGPGKTAPKICEDFLVFDPLKVHNDSSLLADHTPPVGDGPQLGPGIGSCKHDYTTKHEQSITPPLDLRPDGTTQYTVATVCKKCRIHATVRIDYSRAANPCPNSDYSLHHFQRLQAEDVKTSNRISYAWQCSAPQCQAHLVISYRQGRLLKSDEDLLTNTERLKRRYEAVVQQDPSREGVRQATPMEALTRLRKYTKDALNPTHTRRAFPANNKRFMEAFGVEGQDCKELLQRLGFVYANDSEWRLPNPLPVQDRLQADGNSPREALEDVEIEIAALMFRVASETGLVNPAATEGWPSANRDVERVLAAQGYQRHVSLRRAPASNEVLPYFASLGALPDFADSLIIFAYDRQSNCDPEQRAYYFECLQVITEARNTEELQTKLAMLQSEDNISRRDLSAAYRYLNVDGGHNATDEYILNVFQARQQNSGAAAAEEGRQALYKIGVSRASQRLMAASRQSVDTYEEALDWLGNGANKNTSDDFLLSIVALKEENPADQKMARDAISTIARARKSDTLNTWLTSGRIESGEMNVEEALRLLNIPGKVEELDETGVSYLFEYARKDRAGEQTEKAIATIERALRGKDAPVSHPVDSWPVGLQSHGNTCYLNSLLQYYFAFKPFRDIVLEYQKYRLDLTENHEKEERVGQRKISVVEIKGGQRFAMDLQELFNRMIKAYGSSVKPEQDLVCRAFLEPKDYALLASSAMDEETVANGLEAVAAVKLPDAAPTPESSHNGAIGRPRQKSNASSVTLQASVNGDSGDVPMTVDGEMPPTPPDSPSQKSHDPKQQPSHAPPLPPRRFSTTEDVRKAQEKALRDAEAKAKEQQDVTEVHDSVMFRLRAGMKPQGMDDTGEQEDALREYYTIALTETRLDENGAASKAKTPLLDSSIQLNVPYEPTDLYSALDDIFDLQQYGEGSSIETYKTVQKLPQILQISVPRIGYDKVKGVYKTEATVRLEDELYMDRYCDDSHGDVLPKRKRSWGWRKQMRDLQKEQKALKDTTVDLEGPTAIMETANYLNDIQAVDQLLQDVDIDGLGMDEDLASTVATAAQQQKKRLAELEKELTDLQKELDSQFQDLKALKYRLAAVFFHRGSHGGGHYWVCIHDFAKDIWRKYNDELVQEVPASKMDEIFQASKWDHGTPTYLVYVRDDQKDELVQPVCRDPEKVSEPDPWPTNELQMIDNVRPQQEQQQWNTVDPKMTQEGGQQSWDQTRQVADAPW